MARTATNAQRIMGMKVFDQLISLEAIDHNVHDKRKLQNLKIG